MKIGLVKGLILSVLVASTLVSCSGDNEKKAAKNVAPIAVTVGTAGKTTDNVIRASGNIESMETAVISTRIMGFITGIRVKPGDWVKKGQLLVTVSSADISAKRAQAQAMVTESEAALADATKDLERYTQLYEEQSASRKELENITLHYNSIKAKTEAARQMQKEAEAMLAYSNLTAPFAGVITQRNADEGSMASPGIPILVLERSGGYHVNTNVSERDISRIKVGATAEITITSTAARKNGRVSEVSPSSQMSGGQYLVKVSIAEADSKDLYAGMYAHVSIKSSVASGSNDNDRLMIPGEALVQRDQLHGLYTVSDGKVALLRWVTIGKTYGDQVEILSGLSSDEPFVIAADGKLYNGAPVSVKNARLSNNR